MGQHHSGVCPVKFQKVVIPNILLLSKSSSLCLGKRKNNCLILTNKRCRSTSLQYTYRVSIKSFPYYKQMFTWTCWNFTLHLSQKSFSDVYLSNKMVHIHAGVHMFVTFWMQHFQTGGLGEMVRHPGHNDHRISPLLISFYGSMLRTKYFRHQFQILQI